MKRIVSLSVALTILLCLFSVPAMAAGKMSVEQENFHVVDLYSIYGYAFAKIQNTGDKPVEFSAGLLEIYDENGDTLTSTDWLNCYPKVLNPDEVGYVYAYDQVDDAETYSVVDDYMLTVTGKSSDLSVVRYPAVGDYQPNVQVNKYSTYNYVVAEITNDTDSTVFNMNVVIVLLDDNDNILYIAQNDFYSNTGINAGSTITYRDSISDGWYETWEREGVTPTHVEVIAYTTTDDY